MTLPTIKVAVSRDFFKALNNLPGNGKAKVHRFISKFTDDPTSPGLNYEKVHDARDPMIRSLRVDQDIRCIVRAPEEGDTYILLWVDRHDDAYEWARRKICHVNRVSGALQLVDVEAAEQAVAAPVTSAPTPVEMEAPPSGLFDGYEDEQLLQLGVPEALLPSVRAVRSEDALVRLLEWLPQSCLDGLILLQEGRSFEEVLAELDRSREEEINPLDLEAALAKPESQADFFVITDDEALEAMIAAPLELWRVFLHPSQRQLVERRWNGPVRVLGGAGTGKTVAAIHRARWLAQDCLARGEGQVLFTTFTRNLATDIRSNLAKICSPEELKRIEVRNLDAWVADFLKSRGYAMRPFTREGRKAAWQQALVLADDSLDLPESFYEEEWQEVVQPQNCRTLDDYLAARRVGRGTRLTRQHRARIWPVFDALRLALKDRGLWDPAEARQAAAELIAEQGAELPARYSAIVVDEAQDLDAGAFALLRALAGPEHANDLFIVGDPHQRIYGRPVTLSRCGINVRGRSRKLRINYRTTEETRAWATAVLDGLPFDDLDGGEDSSRDYRSLLHGEAPLVKGFENADTELAFLTSLLQGIEQKDGSLGSTCVVARTLRHVEELERDLKSAGFVTRQIQPDEVDDPSDPALRLATMHRVKGLEFNQILIPRLGADHLPLQSELQRRPDPLSREQFLQQERSLLHVAATRAKHRVVVTYFGTPSEFLS